MAGVRRPGMFRMISLVPKKGKMPQKATLLRRAEMTRRGFTTYDELRARGEATRGLRIARSTTSGKRTALGWVTKCSTALGLESEVIDPSVIGMDGAVDRMDVFLEWTADSMGYRNDSGLGLPASVATYANVYVDCHKLLPQPIDLSWLKPYIKDWKTGRTRIVTGGFGIIKKNQKCGFTRDHMEDMYESMDDYWAELCANDEQLVTVVKTAGQVAFQLMLRRSEYTLGKNAEFIPTIHMTRSDFHWFKAQRGVDGKPMVDAKGQVLFVAFEVDAEGNLSAADFEEVLQTQEGRVLVTVKTSKCDMEGSWSANYHPLDIRKDAERVVIKAANYILDMERMDPILNMEERTQEPMFRMPQGKGKQLPTRLFDDVIIGLLLEMHKRRGEHKSMAQIRKLYSLHSFRIGGVNALRAAGVPREIRMILGRWRSDAIDVYSRTDIQQFAKYLRDQGISCREFETLAEDLPQHDEAQRSEFGTAYSASPTGTRRYRRSRRTSRRQRPSARCRA